LTSGARPAPRRSSRRDACSRSWQPPCAHPETREVA
jgi:hypothetical protein